MQIEHLRSAGQLLRRQHPALETACYYAQVTNGKVTFNAVPQDG
jgi:hypothetical protein